VTKTPLKVTAQANNLSKTQQHLTIYTPSYNYNQHNYSSTEKADEVVTAACTFGTLR
jgi:hypothetical protein